MPESDRGGGSGGNDHGNHTNDGALVDQMQARIDSLETQLTTRAGEINQADQAAQAIGADRLKRSPRAAMVEVLVITTTAITAATKPLDRA